MTLIKTVTMSICILSLIYVTLMLLTPERYKQKMRSVVSVLSALIIAGALLKVDFTASDTPAKYPDIPTDGINQSDMVVAELEKRLEQSIGDIYRQNGIPVQKISVETNIDSDNCIFISKISLTVDADSSVSEQRIKKITYDEIGDISLQISFSEGLNGS